MHKQWTQTIYGEGPGWGASMDHKESMGGKEGTSVVLSTIMIKIKQTKACDFKNFPKSFFVSNLLIFFGELSLLHSRLFSLD